MSKSNHDAVELTEEQKEFLLKNGADKPLNELVQTMFNDKTLDGRTKEGIAARKFLAQSNIKYKTTKVVPKNFKLNEDQKEYVQKHLDMMSPHQMTAALFEYIDHVTPLYPEFKAVNHYVERLNLIRNKVDYEKEKFEYKTINTIPQAIVKIHTVLNKKIFKEDSLKPAHEKLLTKFIEYMNATRLKSIMETFNSDRDRVIFEYTFVEHVWDKDDLTTEDVQLFLNVSMNYINQKNIQRQINILNEELEENGSSRTLADMLSAKAGEFNQCETRIKGMLESLNKKRAARQNDIKEQVVNPLSFVQAFMDKEERKNMIKIANYHRELAETEADHMESVNEWKARVLGIDKMEII